MRRSIAHALLIIFAVTAAASGLAAPPPTREERTFLNEAHTRNRSEIELSELARERAESPIVKDYADRVMRDHTDMERTVQRLAAADRLKLSDDAPPEERRLREDLGSLSGAEFDRAYMRRAANDHRNTAAKYAEQERNARDPEIRDFAHEAVSRLREHLALAQRFDPGALPTTPAPVRTAPGADR